MTFVTESQILRHYVAALRKVYFLKTLPEETLQEVAEAGKERSLQKGEVLFLETERCLGLIVVLRGAIKVYKLDSRGRELTLDREMPGESVLELPLFDGGNYPANAEAAEEDTQLLIVPPEWFRRLMVAHPEIAEQALKALGTRTRKLMQMLEAQALYSVRARLADYLLRAANGSQTFALTETNEMIGSQIGTVREVVSRTLRIFADAGAITVSGRTITMKDESILRQKAGNAYELL